MGKKFGFRMLSILLSLVLVLELVLGNVWATGPDGTDISGIESNEMETNIEAASGDTSKMVQGEVDELREESQKHFRMSDGSFLAVDYGMPVHYALDAGSWAEIDNTLLLQSQEMLPALSSNEMQPAEQGEVYACRNGDVTKAFAAVFVPDGTLVSAVKGEVGVAMSLLRDETVQELLEGVNAVSSSSQPGSENSSNSVLGEGENIVSIAGDENNGAQNVSTNAVENDQALDEDNLEIQEEAKESGAEPEVRKMAAYVDAILLDDMQPFSFGEEDTSLAAQVMPEKLSASVYYPDIYPGVDFQYDAVGQNIKESIIINELQTAYHYDFLLELNGLEPELQEDGSILLADEAGEIPYIIPAPYMVDAEGAYSKAVFYELHPTADGYVLSVTADSQWMEESSRALPVVIDPALIATSKSLLDGVIARHVHEGSPNTPSNGANAYLGRGGSTADNYHVYLYFKNLPTIPANCSVVNATVSLYKMDYDSIYNDSKFYGEIHEVTGAKPADVTYTNWINTITWNKAPAYSSTVEDYVEFSQGSGHYADWDISRMVCQWYETAAENRLAVLTPKLVDGKAATAAFYTASNLQSHPPLFIVSYRNNVGMENHYTYQTVSVGRAGTGYVGDYTSQLTLANSFAGSASNTLPFALTAYYNLANRSSYFTDADSAGIHTVNYTKMNLGAGWKLSAQESVRKIAVTYRDETLNYYVYQDADGSEHYFQITGSAPYQDEDGLGLSLTVSGSTITLKDKKDNRREFYNGYLTSIVDANGNAIHFVYNDKAYAAGSTAWKPAANTANYLSKIVRVNDNGGAADVVTTLFTLSYTADGYLSSVADGIGRSTTFTYTAVGGMQRLTAMTFPDGNSAQYAYDANGALTKAFDTESKTGLQFTCRVFAGTLCVEKVQEFAGASIDGTQTVGGAWHLWVHSPYLKEYRFYGPDQTANTADDTVARYTFDYTGKTVNIVNYDGERARILGVSNASYTPNSNTKTKNRVSGAASAGTVAKNLLVNSGFEKSGSWETLTSEVSSMVFAAARNSVPEASPAVKPHTGGYLLKTYVHTTKVSDTGAAFGGVCQRVYLQANVSYTFSAWVSSAGVTKYGKNGGLFLEFCNDSGSVLAASHALDYKTTSEIADGWTRLEVSYTPQTSGWYRLCALQRNAGGYGAFDDLQLEETSSNVQESGASSANLVQLGSFEQPEGGNGAWWNIGSGVYETENALSGYSLRLTGAAEEQRRASQTVSIQKKSDNTYVLSGWARAYSVPNCPTTLKEGESQRFFGLIAKVEYTDGSAPDEHYVSFDCDYTDWQYASGMVVPKQKNKTVATITVYAAYDYNANVCLFDEIALTEEPVQTYTYDEEGNLKAATSTKNSDSAYTYDGADLTKQIAGGYGTYTYDYDSHHNMTKATNDGVSVSATYDEAGNSTGTKLQKSDGTGSYLQTSAAYTADQDHTASVTDANGGKATFGYDALGRNTSVSTQVDTGVTSTTNYTYETGTDRQHSARNSAGGVLYYGYTDGVQTDASRYAANGQASNWQRYHVTADAWGNTTRIQVQGANGTTPASWTEGLTLASYEYARNNGYLDKMTYANGAYETYTYDRYGRVATIAHYSKYDALSYTEVYLYDGNGNTGRCKILDRNGKLTDDYAYEYDSLGRLIRSSQESGGKTLLRTEHLYDLDNRLTKQSYQLGADTFAESYAYSDKDGSMTALTAANGDKLNFAYDSLKRLQTVTAPAYTKNYAYRNLSGSQTTTQTAALTYTGFTNAPVWNYTYTANGNIKTQKKNGYAEAEYTYDTQGQLTNAYLSGKDLSYNYTYDTAGNLQQVAVHGLYHDNENYTNTYTYGNADWADLLTAWGGEPIAYEGQTYDPETNTVTGAPVSGNPISYVHAGVRWNLSWKNGTQLASASYSEEMDNTKISYSYDLNGLRTSKTITKEHYKMVLAYNVYFIADGVLVETMRVAKGTTLQYADLPKVPEKPGYIGSWVYESDPIVKDTVVLAEYTENPITPGPGPGPEIMRGRIPGDSSTTEPMDMVRVLDYTTTEQHDYIYAGGRLLRETVTETAKDKTVTTYTLDFAYDAQGTPYSLTVTMQGVSLTYYYITNLQGDVMYLIDASKNVVVSYDYDPYGKIIGTHDYSTQTFAQRPTEPEDTTKTLAELNPLRYRGYYYDTDDLGFYYLQSRYYDADTCRFISADSYASTGQGFVGFNMFAYCNNEPINLRDSSGKSALLTTLGIMAVGGLLGGIVSTGASIFTQLSTTGTIDFKATAVAFGTGFVGGAVSASPLGPTGQIIAGAAIGGGSYYVECKVTGKEVDPLNMGTAIVFGGISGWIGGAGANQNLELTNMIEEEKKTLLREARRANQTYAQKMVASTTTYVRNSIAVAASSAGVRFYAGSRLANIAAFVATKISLWLSGGMSK